MALPCTAATSTMPASPAAAPPRKHATSTSRADRQAGQARRARIAAHDAQREALRGVPHQHRTSPRRRRCRSPGPSARRGRAAGPSMLTSPIGVVEGLLRLAGSRSGPSTRWLKSGDGDVGEQQARDRLVHAAVLPERAGQRDPEPAHDHRPRRPSPASRRPAPRRPGDARSTAAARPPSTSAPFAADHHQPGLRGQRDAERGRARAGAARDSVFCHENALANPPR